jgi:hypothetical protein
MYVYTTYGRPLSVQAQYSRSCPIISSSCYNNSLVIWTVVCLASAKFKPLIFPVSRFALSNVANICHSQQKVNVMLRPTVQSASLSWNKAPIWGLQPDLYYCQTVAGLFKVKVTLRLTVSQSVSLSVEPHLDDKIFITLWQLWSCFCGAPLWRENGSVFCIRCWPSPT